MYRTNVLKLCVTELSKLSWALRPGRYCTMLRRLPTILDTSWILLSISSSRASFVTLHAFTYFVTCFENKQVIWLLFNTRTLRRTVVLYSVYSYIKLMLERVFLCIESANISRAILQLCKLNAQVHCAGQVSREGHLGTKMSRDLDFKS